MPAGNLEEILNVAIQREQDLAIRDSYLESLRSIYEAGYLRQFVQFEMIAPFTRYQLTSLLSPEDRVKLGKYIERFVVIRERPGAARAR